MEQQRDKGKNVFVPKSIPLAKGDVKRIVKMSGASQRHVWDWYNGRTKSPTKHEAKMIAALTKIGQERLDAAEAAMKVAEKLAAQTSAV